MFTAPETLPSIESLLHQLSAKPRDVARLLGVQERTVRTWCTNGDMPRAAQLALFWETHTGRWLIAEQAMNERAAYYRRALNAEAEAAKLREEIALLRKFAEFGAANASAFGDAGERRETL